ncbi:MAG TPA: HlyD family efflux transporter periplasmic adaptor subunit [Longimicrobium sp.]|nr:HlyD family efflux transporter periplasmic adaptor subunit [Longimicrobium sp.]
MKTRSIFPAPLVLASCAMIVSACGDDEPDAWGNFEANEVVVSAQVGGQILSLAADDGQRLPAGAVVGQIDTAALALQRAELQARQGAARTRTTEAEAQIDVLEAQLATAGEEYARTLRLYRAEAATAQQLNQAEGEVRVLRERIEAARAQTGVVVQEAGGADARIGQIDEQISRSRVTNPISGTVLTTYAEPGEFVATGQPLYKIADLGTLTLRAYVSGAQLPRVRIGGRVQVRIDSGEGDELAMLPGEVAWVASEAEFTPTPIQTREERTDQVYAVKVRVPNPNGVIKIGMPGELVLSQGGASTRTAAAGAPLRR